MNLDHEWLLKLYPWYKDFTPEDQDLIRQELSTWGKVEEDKNTFLGRLLHALIEQDIQLGHYKFGLRQTLEEADRTLWIQPQQIRAHFYKVIHHVE